MSQAASPPPLAPAELAASSSDALDQLALTAARTQRRNQPRALVVLGVLAVLGALTYASMGWRARSDARDRLATTQEFDTKVRTALAKLKALQDASGAGGATAASEKQTGEHALSTIIELAGEAGLASPLGATTPNTSDASRAQGWSQTTYVYTVKDPSIDAVLRWMELVLERIPGMGINKLTVRPEPTVWSVTVEFARWHRPDQARAGAGGRAP